MHRFFLAPENFRGDTVTILDPEIIHQLTRVLRSRVGDELIFLDGSGAEFVANISNLEKTKIIANVKECRENSAEPAIQITLYQALPKNPARFEQVVQHGTEIGIVKFVPIISERTEVQTLRNPERFRRIIREAAEQSGRGTLPVLTEPLEFQALVQNSELSHGGTHSAPLPNPLFPNGGVHAAASIIGDSFGSPPLLVELLPTLKTKRAIQLFIGPEGGFSEAEILFAQKNGIVSFSLGKRILRTETAGLAVASALLFS